MKFSIRLWTLLSLLLSLLAASPLQAQTGNTYSRTIMSGGQNRHYLLYVPKSYQPGKLAPLIVNMHGQNNTVENYINLSKFPLVADSAGFLLVYPQALTDTNPDDTPYNFYNQTCWNAFYSYGRADDAGFIADLITEVQRTYTIDAQRVYATGHSNGGFMTFLLAAQLSTRLAAIAPISGGIGDGRIMNSNPRPVPVFAIHGEKDNVVSYSEDLIKQWATINGCASTPALDQLTYTSGGSTTVVKRSVWSTSTGTRPVISEEVMGAIHNLDSFLNFTDPMAGEIWRFLRKYRLPSSTSPAPGANLALNKPVSSSGLENSWLPSSAAVDGNAATRWASVHSDAQWLTVDLGANYNVDRVKIKWEASYGKDYDVEISSDVNADKWTLLQHVTNNTNLTPEYTGLGGTGRYVRIKGYARANTQYGYSIYELEIYGPAAASITADGIYELEPQNALGQRLDVYGLNINSGAMVWICQRNGGANQQWKFSDRGNGVYELAPQHAPDQRLDVYYLSTAENAAVLTSASNHGLNQQWKATAIGGGIYELEPQNALGKLLDTGVVNGVTQTLSKTATHGNSQRWKLYPVAGTPAARLLAQSALPAEAGVLSVFPNPATATVTLSGVATLPATAELYDARGVRLSTTQLTQASDGLDISQLTTGLYTLRVSSAQTVQTVRLQKN